MSKPLTTQEFIERANIIHNFKYKYDKTIYTKTQENVIITCPIHGDYKQTPMNHLQGRGCRECAKITNRIKHLKNIDYYIPLFIKIHGSKYSYAEAVYQGSKKAIDIICPIHGKFQQTVENHLEGKGCPYCNSSHLETEIRIFLQNKNIAFNEQQKFQWLGRQSLDFYLPEYNIAIECQGKQHFGLGGWSHDFNFDKLQELDKRKKELCDKNNVKLLYYSNLGINYPYHVYENKEKLLQEIALDFIL